MDRAACDELVHAQSNVALFAAYTNPRLRLHYLGHREVFDFHDRQAVTPPRFRLDFRAFGMSLRRPARYDAACHPAPLLA